MEALGAVLAGMLPAKIGHGRSIQIEPFIAGKDDAGATARGLVVDSTYRPTDAVLERTPGYGSPPAG